MAATGGGHAASAESLRSAFTDRCGSRLRVDVVDLWSDDAPWPLNQVPHVYRPLVDRSPWLWKLIYSQGRNPRVVGPTLNLVWHWTRRRARAVLESHRPTLVVSVHALLQDIPLRVLSEWRRQRGRSVPFVTVVSDLVSAHPLWFHKAAALCFVPTSETRSLALQAGLRPDRVRQHGFPIRSAFARRPIAKQDARAALGMRDDLPLILMIGGGEGMGRMEESARTFAARLAATRSGDRTAGGQLAVVCGRNLRLRARLGQRPWPIPTVVTGFIGNVWDWMAASEFVITKAGPNTIMEACASGLPLLISGYVSGQEEGNVDYVVRNGIGAYGDSPDRIAEIGATWLGPERPQLGAMARRARLLSRHDAARNIVDDIVALGGPLDG